MDRWSGKVCVITGASSGIGACLAEKLVDLGLVVVGLARRVERVESSAKEFADRPGKLHAYRCDVTKSEDIVEAFEWITSTLGPVSVLINNAGITKHSNLIDGDEAVWRKIIDTNVMGLCVATKEAIRSMKANDIAGHIVHVNSVAGHTPFAYSMYSPSKYAVTCLTEVMRRELLDIGSNIKVSSISPGMTDTEILTLYDENEKIPDEIPKLKAEDVADSIIHILSTPPHVQIHDLIIKPIGESF